MVNTGAFPIFCKCNFKKKKKRGPISDMKPKNNQKERMEQISHAIKVEMKLGMRA